MSVLIIEGPDRAGKTSLSELVFTRAVQAGFIPELVHNPAPPSRIRDKREYMHWIYRAQFNYAYSAWVEDRRRLLILDRGHHSEAVYGFLYRGERLELLPEIEQNQHYPVITCLLAPELGALLSRDDGASTWGHENRDAVPDRILREINAFHMSARKTCRPVLVFTGQAAHDHDHISRFLLERIQQGAQ